MSDDEKQARVLMRELGHYLISASSSEVELEDVLVELAIPMPSQNHKLHKIDDSIKLSRIAKREYVQRIQRSKYFEGDLFADPAWDMLLDLYISKVSGIRISITSLCIASHVPPTTALRWIGVLEEFELLRKIRDSADQRRVWVELTDLGSEKMEGYLRDVHKKYFVDGSKFESVRNIAFSEKVVIKNKVNDYD